MSTVLNKLSGRQALIQLENSFLEPGPFPRIPAARFGISGNIKDVLLTMNEEKPLSGFFFVDNILVTFQALAVNHLSVCFGLN